MKKILLILFVIYSSIANAEWVVLSCNNKAGSVIVEFDVKIQKIRFQNDNNRIYDGKISEYVIDWKSSLGVQNSNEKVYFLNHIDRLTGVYETMSTGGVALPPYECSSQKKKF